MKNVENSMAAIVICLLILPSVANAYIGPGAGISAIGSLVAMIFALLVAILGFVWYPIKRIIKGSGKPQIETEQDVKTADMVED